MQDHRTTNLEAVLVSDLIAMVARIDGFFQSNQLMNRIDDVYQQDGDLSKIAYDNLNALVVMHFAQRDNLSLQEFVNGLGNIIAAYEAEKNMSRLLASGPEPHSFTMRGR